MALEARSCWLEGAAQGRLSFTVNIRPFFFSCTMAGRFAFRRTWWVGFLACLSSASFCLFFSTFAFSIISFGPLPCPFSLYPTSLSFSRVALSCFESSSSLPFPSLPLPLLFSLSLSPLVPAKVHACVSPVIYTFSFSLSFPLSSTGIRWYGNGTERGYEHGSHAKRRGYTTTGMTDADADADATQ